MLTYATPALLLVGSSASDATAGGRKLSQQEFHKDLYGKSKSSAALRKKFISKSTFIGGRKLYQNYNNYNNYNNRYNNQYNNQYNNNQAQQAQAEEEDVEGEQEEEVEVDDKFIYGDDGEQWENDYGFEPSKYALSYHRCAAVQQFDDQIAAKENSNTVFTTKNFAIFRFCPAYSCDAEIVEDDDAYEEDAEAEEEDGEDGRRRKLEDAEAEEAWYQMSEEVYGARGKGCKRNYGEYMIELEYYLQIMAEHQQEKAEGYCQYCEDFMYQIYQEYMQQQYEQQYQNYNNGNRQLEFDEFKKDIKLHRELQIDYGVCEGYPNVCYGAITESELIDYFECKQMNGAFIGPHCAEDGFTITLGVYADENCNEFVGGDVADVLGADLDEDALKSWYNSKHGTLDILYEGQEDSLCIPCQKQDEDFENLGNDDGDDFDDQVDYSDNEISDICEKVYQESAHCHRHYQTFRKGNLSDRQWQEEQLSCAFIESIVMGNYDEFGYVNLQSKWNWRGEKPQWARDNMYASQYRDSTSDVTPLQVFFLIFTILACIILGVWSKTLHASLVKKVPWAPGRHLDTSNTNIFRRPDNEPEILPADSGIGLSRVRSDATGIGESRVRSEATAGTTGTSYYLT